MLQLAYPMQSRLGALAASPLIVWQGTAGGYVVGPETEPQSDIGNALTLWQGVAGSYIAGSQTLPESKPSKVIALTLDTLSLATASAYSMFYDFQGIVEMRGPAQAKANKKQVAAILAPSTAQLLLKVRDVFALRMSDLAQIFGVSRRAAYDWLEGVTPRQETVARIYTLSQYAETLRAAGIPHIEHYVHRPIVAGRSLLDLLKSGENIGTAIDVIKHTASEESKNRKQLGRRTSPTNTVSIDDGFDEVSTPISD